MKSSLKSPDVYKPLFWGGLWGIVLAAISSHGFAQFGGGGMGGGRRGRSTDTPSASHSNDPSTNPQAQANALRDKLYDLRLRLMITPEPSERSRIGPSLGPAP